MNFAFSEEQEELRRIVRQFLDDKSPEAEVRRLMETEEGYDTAVWRQMAEQLGLQGLIVVRPGSWTNLAGESPVRVIAGEPGSRPRFVVERLRAERGVESLFGGSKHAGRSATRRESCSLVRLTMGGAEPLMSR